MQLNPLEALPQPALPSDSNDASNDIVKSEVSALGPESASEKEESLFETGDGSNCREVRGRGKEVSQT